MINPDIAGTSNAYTEYEKWFVEYLMLVFCVVLIWEKDLKHTLETRPVMYGGGPVYPFKINHQIFIFNYTLF